VFYIITGLLLYLIALYSINNKNLFIINACNILTISIIILVYGLRFEIGSDWSEYIKYYSVYEENDIGLSSIHDLGFSFGYAYPLAIKFLTELGLSFNGYLLIHGLFLYGSTFFSARNFIQRRDVPFIITSIFISTIGCWGSDRQLIGLSIGIAALIPLFKRQFILYIFLIIIATLFHSYNILFMLLILQAFIKPKRIYILCILISPVIVYLLFIYINIENIVEIFSRYDQNVLRYLTLEDSLSPSILSLAFKIVLTIPGLILFRVVKENDYFLYIYKINLLFTVILISSFFLFNPVYQRSLFISNFLDILMIYFICKNYFSRFSFIVYPILILISAFKGYRSIVYAYDMFVPYNSIILFSN